MISTTHTSGRSTESNHILTAHIVVETSGYDAMREIKCRVKEAAAGLGISPATIEVEGEGEECPVAEAY